MMHLFHKWTRWETLDAVYYSPLRPGLGEWTDQVQVKRCKTCGRLKVKELQ